MMSISESLVMMKSMYMKKIKMMTMIMLMTQIHHKLTLVALQSGIIFLYPSHTTDVRMSYKPFKI